MKNKYGKYLAVLFMGTFMAFGCDEESDSSSGSAGGDGEYSAIVDATGDDWVYLNMSTGETVDVDDPENDMNWDMGFFGAKIQTNSGVSGPGAGGAYDSGESNMAAVTDGEVSFEVDVAASVMAGPPPAVEYNLSAVLYGCDYIVNQTCSYEGWYDYDSSTHIVSPKDKVFIIRRADEVVVKLKIIGYSSGLYNLEWSEL